MVELVVRETLLWNGRLGKGKPYCGYQVSVYFIQTTKNSQWSKLGDQKFWQFDVKKNGGNLQPQPFWRPQCEQSREPTGEDPMHRTHPWPSERCSWRNVSNLALPHEHWEMQDLPAWNKHPNGSNICGLRRSNFGIPTSRGRVLVLKLDTEVVGSSMVRLHWRW